MTSTTCPHGAVYTFTPDDFARDRHNPNYDHAACLDCGVIGSCCDYCGAFFPVAASAYGGAIAGGFYSNGVESCTFCRRCVRCCDLIGKELPLRVDDIRAAALRFIRANRHCYIRGEHGAPKHSGMQMDATRYSVEEHIVSAATAHDAAKWLGNETEPNGEGRRGDLVVWRPRGAGRTPAGLRVNFDHRRGVIDALSLARVIRDLPRRSFVCLGCGGEFTSALAECPFWNHQLATMAKHGLDTAAYWESAYRGRRGRLLIVDDVAPVERPVFAAPSSTPQLALF